MELIVAILGLGLVAAPLAILGAWLATSAQRGLGSVIPRSGEGWWRATLPWPQGVQEEDAPGWNLDQASPQQQPGDESPRPGPDDREVRLVRLHPTIRTR